MRVLKTRPDQPEMIQQMVERLSCDRHAKTSHVGKIRQTKSARFMCLAEYHLLLLAVNGSPRPNASLQCAANALGRFRVATQDLIINGNGPNAGCGFAERNDLRF